MTGQNNASTVPERVEVPQDWKTSKEGRIEYLVRTRDRLVGLVEHEDKLNWSKFNNFLYMTLGLLGGFAVSMAANDSEERCKYQLLMCVGGLISSVGFWQVLRSGIQCIECHKDRVIDIDKALAHLGISRIFFNREATSRMMLNWTPPVGLMLWLVLTALTVHTHSDYLLGKTNDDNQGKVDKMTTFVDPRGTGYAAVGGLTEEPMQDCQATIRCRVTHDAQADEYYTVWESISDPIPSTPPGTLIFERSGEAEEELRAALDDFLEENDIAATFDWTYRSVA